MAGENKTFNAKVAGVVDIQAGDSPNIIKNLLDLQKQLTLELKKTANEATNVHSAIGQPKSEEELDRLKAAVKALAGDLKALGLVSKTAKLVNVDDVKTANELEQRINAIVKAYDSMAKQKKIEAGAFGLDRTDPKKAVQDLKELEKASKAVQAAMSMKGDPNGDLAKYKQKIDANTQALVKHIDTMRSALALEDAHAKALIANADFDKKRSEKLAQLQAKAIAENIQRDKAETKRQEDEAQRRADKMAAIQAKAIAENNKRDQDAVKKVEAAEQRKLEAFQNRMTRQREAEQKAEGRRALAQQDLTYRLANSGSAQLGLNRAQLDFSSIGRGAAAYRFQVESERASQFANPAFQAQDALRRQRLREEQALTEIYRNAGVRPESSGFYKLQANEAGDQRRVQAAQNIVALQRQLVDLQLKGQLTDSESLRLRTQISTKVQEEIAARNKAGNLQAQQNQAERNMARVQGIGGASLLAVQASLMANYSILNGFTGSIRSAVSGSVDLEAALKNVQAVTATTDTEMKDLEERIKSVAASSKFSSTEVANAALTLGQAGLSAKQISESIQSVTQLAAASGTSLAQAVDLVTSVLGVFDKNASDTADIANKITQAANSSKVSVEKLALGFQYAGNTAAQAGISFEETTAAMSAMSNAGIRSGSTMGTGLRQFITETQKPSEEFLATINRIGLSMSDLDFKSHGLIGVARKLREAGFIASDAIKSFDVRGAAAFNALIANPDELERQYGLLLNTQAGLKANEIQMDSLKSQATRLTTSLVNLASTGFAPLSGALQWVADKTATATQAATEYKTTAGLLGSLLAGALTTAMLAHVASLASGAAALMGLNTATLTAFRSMTLLGAGQGILNGLSARWGVLRGAVAATGTAYTIAASQGTAATGLWTVATGTLTSAMRGLWVVIQGLSMTTVIGAAVAAVAAGYYILNSSSANAREEMDKLKAKSVEAKDAFEDKKKTLESLNERINELNYKQKETKVSSEDLKNTGMSLNAQFGAIGLSIDSNTKSYGEMITKMKEVRTEMQQLALAKLRIALDENRKLEAKQGAEVQQNFTTLRSNGVSTIDRALKRSDNLLPGQVKVLQDARSQFASGNLSNLSSLENARAIISQLAQSLRGKVGVGNYGDVEKFDTLVEKMDTFVRSASELQLTKSEGSALNVGMGNFKDNIAYRQRNVTVGDKQMPLEQVLETYGGNMRAKVGSTGNKLADYDKFYQASRDEIGTLMSVKDQLEGDLQNPKANKDVVSQALMDIRARIEGIKTDVKTFAGETQAKAEREYRNESMRLKAIIGSTKATPKEDRAKAQRDLAALDKQYKTRAVVDPDEKYNMEQAIDETGEIRASNILAGGQGSKHDREAQIRERVLKAQEAAFLRAAEADKADAGLTQDLELVEQLWDSGLENLKKARKKAVEAVKVRQAKERQDYKGENLEGMEKVWNEELRTVNFDFDQRMRQFTDSFKGFGKTAALALKAMEESITKRKQEIANQKVSGEDRVYDESSNLRELELAQALGKKVKDKTFSQTTRYDYGTERGDRKDGTADNMAVATTIGSKGVTTASSGFGMDGGAFGGGTAFSRGSFSGSGDLSLGAMSALTGTLKQRIARETVRVGRIELEENEKYLEALGDASTGLIGDLTKQLETAQKEYEITKDRIVELEALKKQKKLNAEQQEELRKAQEDVSRQGSYVKSVQGDLNTAVRDRRAARKDNGDIQTKIAKYTEELPEELTLDSAKKKIQDVVSTWKEAVQEMNATKVLGDGITSILGGITGQLGNSFSAILSGTKSIKSAVRDMATSVIKSMLDILAQISAMQAIKGIMGALGFGSMMLSPGATAGMTDVSSAAMDFGNFAAASGGYVTSQGRLQRVQAFANGGTVRGGVQNRDSVPARLMPGEFILKKTAVDAVGTDYLHSLNQATNSVVSSSAPKSPSQNNKQDGATINVYVVTPDQKPSGLGPKDVVVMVADDITRGGSIKKLIKQVQTNQI